MRSKNSIDVNVDVCYTVAHGMGLYQALQFLRCVGLAFLSGELYSKHDYYM